MSMDPPKYKSPTAACLTVCVLALAGSAWPAAGHEGALRFDRVTVEDGLSGPMARPIHQDGQGFLWFGTSEGLERYDGYAFKVYRHDPEDPRSLSDHSVEVIYTDRSGMLWIGTATGGLNRYRRSDDAFVHYRHAPGDTSSLSDDTVTALLEDDAGNLWVGTANGLNRRHRHTETFRRFQNDPSDPQSLGGQSVSSLCEGRSGELWIGTDSGLDRLDVETGGFSHFVHDPTDLRTLSDDQVLAIQQDADGRLWIATPSGLDRLDPGSGLVERYRHDPGDARSLSRGRVTALWIDRQGTLWIGSENGLAVFDRDRGTFDRHLHDLADPWSLSNSYVISLFEDRTGVLWIGTFDGVSRYAPGRDGFVTYRRQTGRVPTLSGADVWAVVEDRTGALWIAYGAFGLDRFDREAGTIVHYAHDPADPESLPAGPTATVYEDRGGVIWVGSFGGGLSRLEGPSTTPGDGRARQRFRHFRHHPADPGTLSSNEVQRLYEDSAGRFWVATPKGLNVLDRHTGRAVRYPLRPQDPPTLATARISSIVEDRQGTLWIGSFNEGLYRLGSPSAAGDQRFRRFVHDPGDAGSLRSDEVIALHVDRTGCLWIGTISGLDRRHPGRATFDHFQKQDGLPGSMIRGILEDDAGFLWISTNRGLSRLDPRNGTARNYAVDDGLQSNSFSTKAEFKSPSGELFFGGRRGLNAFFPDRIADDPMPPQVVLTDFRLFNRSMPPRDRDPDSPLERSILDTRELVLTHRDYVFGIEFAALHYAAPRKNRYSYRLEGLDPEWIETDASQRFVQYSNLAPGKYVFRVKASNKDGIWNDEGAAIAITVRPPPWRTWWAYALYAAALAAAVVGSTRRQRQKLRREQLEAERERRISARLQEVDRLKDEFLANTSHELRTPLYGITGLAESLIDGATGELPMETKAHLSMIVASGRRLGSLVNDILDFSKLKHQSLELDLRPVDLRALVDVVLTLLRPLVTAKDLALKNAVDPDLPPVLADENRLQQILYNLAGNAVKFTEAGEVEIAAAQRHERLVVSVRDTGIGISQQQQERIFEAFAQADGRAEREFGGTGLGLAVTRQLLELHGGSLSVESAPGKGSTFRFDLPVAPDMPAALSAPVPVPVIEADDGGPPSATAAPEPVAGEALASILVVDDEPVIRQVLVNQLAAEGYAITQAASGPEALERIEERSYDLVLLDVMMPRMSGYEVCRALRERHPLDELPVIFLTAKNQAEDLVVGFAAGANDYLPKPISKSELLARITTHLGLLSVSRRLSELVAERTTQVEERERLLAERERLIGELEVRNAELARFNYTVSHDLKNPLVTIKNFLGVLRRDTAAGQTGRMEHDLDRLETAADTLHRLLEQLFEFSRVGVQTNPPEEIAMGELVGAAVEELAGAIAERGVEVVVAEELPVVRGDRVRLLEMARHLLGNAVEYLGDQAAPRIEVGLRGDGSEKVFYVRDNGVGIDPKYHEKIFGLFERLAPEASEGTGIGLALVKRIVEVHGGRIWIESQGAGRGATFCFTLP